MRTKQLKTAGLPPAKPWCFRVTRTGAKKYGARENWPRDMRNARSAKQLAKRSAHRDPTEEELWLRAEIKAGGLEAQVARMKLRAIKQRKKIDAEDIRRELAERIARLRVSRGVKP